MRTHLRLIEIKTPAPVLNTPDFRRAFGGDSGADVNLRHVEFVALPGEQFSMQHIHPRHDHAVYQVASAAYPASPLYLDSRFTCEASRAKRPLPLLLRNVLAQRMESLLGTAYIWGGNWSRGIEVLLYLYPPKNTIDEATLRKWSLKGVDCSGLLYQASEGATPRNTRELVSFGETVPAVLEQLRTMDMIVWPGHVWFVLDKDFAIESRSPFGVIKTPLRERFEETVRERKGDFVIKRFAK